MQNSYLSLFTIYDKKVFVSESLLFNVKVELGLLEMSTLLYALLN